VRCVSDNSWEREVVGKFLRASAAPLSFFKLGAARWEESRLEQYIPTFCGELVAGVAMHITRSQRMSWLTKLLEMMSYKIAT
jgi:hypothetical protein